MALPFKFNACISWLLAATALAAAETPNAWVTCFGGTPVAGIAVDRNNGDVFAVSDGKGIFKSVDHGKTFVLVNDSIVKSHAETGCGLSIDPEGGRIMCFMCYGDAGGSYDGGKTWFKSGKGHWNWGVVDWSDPLGNTMLGNPHGDGGVSLSVDQGKTWKGVNGGGVHVGIADANSILVGGEGGIFLSANGGNSWQKVSDFRPKGRTMRVFKGRCYWLDDDGVIASSDHGRTWARLGTKVDACVGPFFGNDEHSLLVVGLSGFAVTHDDGATWRTIAALPEHIRQGWSAPEGGLPRDYWFVQFGWDPKQNILYTSSWNTALIKCELAIDPEVLAMVDQIITQVERLKDPASPAYHAAAIKLYVGTASLPLDAVRAKKVDALTATVKDEIVLHQDAVRAALDAWDPASFDQTLAVHRKPFTGTILAGWFADAALVGKANVAIARIRRRGSNAVPGATSEAVQQQLDALRARLGFEDLRERVDHLKVLFAKPSGN